MARSTRRSQLVQLAVPLLVAAGLLAGCGKDVVDGFPLSVGFQPLEPLVAGAACPESPNPAGLTYPRHRLSSPSAGGARSLFCETFDDRRHERPTA